MHDTVFGFFSLMNVYFTVLANAKFNFILLYFFLNFIYISLDLYVTLLSVF